MTKTLTIETESITTRRRAAAIVEAAVSEGSGALDFAAVSSVSRSVADEFIGQATTHGIELRGRSGGVERMFERVTDRPSIHARNPPLFYLPAFSASGGLTAFGHRSLLTATESPFAWSAEPPVPLDFKKLDQKVLPRSGRASSSILPFASLTGTPLGSEPLAPCGRSRMLLPDGFFDNLDFLVGQPIQLIHNLVDQIISLLDFRLQLLGALLGLRITL